MDKETENLLIFGIAVPPGWGVGGSPVPPRRWFPSFEGGACTGKKDFDKGIYEYAWTKE